MKREIEIPDSDNLNYRQAMQQCILISQEILETTGERLSVSRVYRKAVFESQINTEKRILKNSARIDYQEAILQCSKIANDISWQNENKNAVNKTAYRQGGDFTTSDWVCVLEVEIKIPSKDVWVCVLRGENE